ncbi:hypothetical protein ACFL2V_00040 [Pseudomonadota bacterium]
MTIFDQRRQRILDSLPRIYTAQPESSAVGAVINMMAQSLADIDNDISRVMRDRWINFASCTESAATEADVQQTCALESLGHLMDIRRLPGEKTENYRQRLIITSNILLNGLTTPGALLQLAIASLGAEPCEQIRFHADAVIASGMRLGSALRCVGCKTKRLNDDCANPAQKLLEIYIIENPLVAKTKTLSGIKPEDTFRINNPSIVEDISVITLRAGDNEVPYPGLRNMGTNEIVFYAGNLKPGEKLEIWPPVTADFLSQYESYEKMGHHEWALHNPEGLALLTNEQGDEDDVSDDIFFYTGSVFDTACFALPGEEEPRFTALKFADDYFAADDDEAGARFDEAEFSIVQSKFNTPRVRIGEDDWIYRTYTYDDIKSVAGDEGGRILQKAPKSAATAQLDITLEWWSRPPATFRMSIPNTPWIREARARGAVELLYQQVERARAAGVNAIIDFPEPVNRETHPIKENFVIKLDYTWGEHQTLGDSAPEKAVHIQRRESHALSDGNPLFPGEFDNTGFDFSYFNE